jgi:uncharacterized protein
VSDTQKATIRAALLSAHAHMAMLRALAHLDLPDAWIAAGAVRNAVWDALHAYTDTTPLDDVDMIWFDASRADEAQDRRLEHRLGELLPGPPWSVKNQARMHLRNGDAPYMNCLEAMRCWPETATCVAARLARDGTIELSAPYGFDDLLGCVLRPTPHFASCRIAVFRERIGRKRWRQIWPLLSVAHTPPDCDAATSGNPGGVECLIC